ncbi:hypothetical protein PHJA_000409800 [Phtheirospermum japonicum]|uniref:Uncharacterized protein n=1 Tax=Phtheirospermum japonicum TaxID=374723 RepID=A0A830B6H4_9LAMI|nr:hypothetical protein PHJA_000409800 [Phtheirospermum japonicum]
MTGGGSGSGSGGGVNKLATALIIIFAISLLALLAELFYVFWRRRVFRRQASPVGGGGDEISQISSSESTFSSIAPSKDLLYFLCVRPPQFRLERNSATANSEASDLNSDRQQSEMEVNIDIDLLKIQGMFGPPRFLFTIKEEEREDLESPAEKSLCAASKNKIDDEKVCRVSLEEHFKAAEVKEAVGIDDVGVDDATPFSTPCASPPYFTPSASPVHVVLTGE